MTRALALILLLAITGTALAVEGKPKAGKLTREEQFWQSEEGIHIEQLFDKFLKGEIDFDTAQREYNKRWEKAPLPGPPPVKLPRMKQ